MKTERYWNVVCDVLKSGKPQHCIWAFGTWKLIFLVILWVCCLDHTNSRAFVPRWAGSLARKCGWPPLELLSRGISFFTFNQTLLPEQKKNAVPIKSYFELTIVGKGFMGGCSAYARGR